MSTGTNNCQQLSSNRKSAIKIGSVIDYKAYLTCSKKKKYYPKYKLACNTRPVQRSITRVKQRREKALKGSANTKGALVRNPLAITYVASIYPYVASIYT